MKAIISYGFFSSGLGKYLYNTFEMNNYTEKDFLNWYKNNSKLDGFHILYKEILKENNE